MQDNPFQAPQHDGSNPSTTESGEETRKVYIKLLHQFLFSGIMIGIGGGVLVSYVTNWVIGLAYGFVTGFLFIFGMASFLTIAGKKNRVAAREEKRLGS